MATWLTVFHYTGYEDPLTIDPVCLDQLGSHAKIELTIFSAPGMKPAATQNISFNFFELFQVS